MKKLLLIPLALSLLISCQNNKQEMQRLVEVNDSLTIVTSMQDRIVIDYVEAFNEIQNNLNEIKKAENIITLNTNDLNNELSPGDEERIIEDIKLINDLMDENKRKISNLEQKLKASGGNNNELQKMITYLQDQMLAKDLELAKLNDKLDALNIEVKNLSATLDTVKTESSKKSKIIEEQIKRWELGNIQAVPLTQTTNVITISRESGSRGLQVAEKLADQIGFDLFHHEILEAMIETSKTSKALLETLDERGMNIVDDIVSALVHEHHLWPDDYSKLLLRILNTIGKHGNAIILGRGGNCALNKFNILRVRIVAPASMRREYIQTTRDLSFDDAQKQMISTDANRSAFVKRYFNSDASDPANYDLILNTGTLSVEKTVRLIKCAIGAAWNDENQSSTDLE